MKKINVLITGGAGFVGSHLAEKLISMNYRVTVADNLSRCSLSNIKHILKDIKLLNVDLRTHGGSMTATKKQDVVFNLAAVNTGIDYDSGRTHYMFEENMLLQMQPIRAAALNQVRRFIQISSASIYSRESMDNHVPTKETDDQEIPESSKLGYALAKKMGENLAIWYAKNTSMSTVVIRPANIYGPRDHYDSYGHFIPVMTKKIIEAKKVVEVFGSGSQKRSFLHVEDAVNGFILLSKKGENGEVYNIDSQDEHTVKEIVYIIRKILQKNNLSVHFNTNFPEGSKRRMLDNQKIKRLGWNPKNTLTNSLPSIVHSIASLQI